MVFYFTATGNGKFIAERVANALNEQAINITNCVQDAQYIFELSEGENVGVVVPVYYLGIPMIVSEFLEKVKISTKQNYYSYAILHCGGYTGGAGRYIHRVTKIDALYGMVAPDNYSPMSKLATEDEVKTILDKAEQEVEKIVGSIRSKAVGTFNPVTGGSLSRLLTPVVYPAYIRGRKTNKFKVNDKCIGCKLCEEICPRKVINCMTKKPVWNKPQCEVCLACLNRCPTAAIEYGRSSGNGQYVNPRVSL